MDLEKAIDFVRKNGNDFDKARLSHILGKEFDVTNVLNGFSLLQNPDGGFPYCDRKGFPSCLSNTAMAIHSLLELGLRDSEPVQRAMDFLEKMRKGDGTWEENPKIMPLDPPFWDMPGDRETSIWLTADIADVMMRSGRPVPPETFAFLRSCQGPDGRFEGFYHTTWIALSLFGKNGHPDDSVLSPAIAYLENIDLEDWDTSCIAWCLDCINNGLGSGSSALRDKLISRLSETQVPDGSWPSDGGERMKLRDALSVLACLSDGAYFK
jgi:prenyltransferase beta subunit